MGKTVLIVDDSNTMRKIVSRSLRQAGIDFDQIFEAGDGQEALDVLAANQVDVVLSDINMPNMNGIEACKRIKQNPRTRNIPVIMCSSKSTRDNVLAAVNSGARDFIVKPINKKEALHGIEIIKESIEETEKEL